jgi:hypothetical protein
MATGGSKFPLEARFIRINQIFKTKREEAIVFKKKSRSFLLGFSIFACLLVSQQLFAQSQPVVVPVEQEPRHWVVFQNQYTRIYDCLIPPGDMTLFHTRFFDNVAVPVSGGKLRNEIPGQAPTERVWFWLLLGEGKTFLKRPKK